MADLAGGYSRCRQGRRGRSCLQSGGNQIRLAHLQHTVAKDIFATLSVLLQDGEMMSCLVHTSRGLCPIFSPRVISQKPAYSLNR